MRQGLIPSEHSGCWASARLPPERRLGRLAHELVDEQAAGNGCQHAAEAQPTSHRPPLTVEGVDEAGDAAGRGRGDRQQALEPEDDAANGLGHVPGHRHDDERAEGHDDAEHHIANDRSEPDAGRHRVHDDASQDHRHQAAAEEARTFADVQGVDGAEVRVGGVLHQTPRFR